MSSGLGAVFGEGCFDITKAIGDDLLEFPRVVFTIEEVLQVKDGLQLLEEQLRGFATCFQRNPKLSCSTYPTFLFDAPIMRPAQNHRHWSEL